jgi:hypothetical protein
MEAASGEAVVHVETRGTFDELKARREGEPKAASPTSAGESARDGEDRHFGR